MPGDVEEQCQIAAVIDQSDIVGLKTQTRLEKLKRTKTGIMHDLFTGRARVKELLPIMVP
jgi:hypothetical protein